MEQTTGDDHRETKLRQLFHTWRRGRRNVGLIGAIKRWATPSGIIGTELSWTGSGLETEERGGVVLVSDWMTVWDADMELWCFRNKIIWASERAILLTSGLAILRCFRPALGQQAWFYHMLYGLVTLPNHQRIATIIDWRSLTRSNHNEISQASRGKHDRDLHVDRLASCGNGLEKSKIMDPSYLSMCRNSQ